MLADVISSETEINNPRFVDFCQAKNARFVYFMKNTSFGERLLSAFGNAKQVEIAAKMGVSPSAVKNYVDGRVPDADKLLLIKKLTNCDLDWLLTGEEKGERKAEPEPPRSFEEALDERIRAIVRAELDAREENVVFSPIRPTDIMISPSLGAIDVDEEEEAIRRTN